MSQVSAAADTRYRIRVAQREDLPAIVAIYNATIPSRMVTADLVPVSVNDRLPSGTRMPTLHRSRHG